MTTVAAVVITEGREKKDCSICLEPSAMTASGKGPGFSLCTGCCIALYKSLHATFVMNEELHEMLGCCTEPLKTH